MALNFQPPEWLIQDYMRRRTSYEEAAQGLQQGLGNFAAIDQIKRQNQIVDMQAAQMGYDPNNPAAYWGRYNADRQRKAELEKSQTYENTARGDYYNRMPVEKGATQQEQPTDYYDPATGQKKFTLPPGGKLIPPTVANAGAKASKETSALDSTFNLYETARDGLLAGLKGTKTGPIMGRIPAVTSGQQTAEGGVAAMAPVLKQLFRVSGEGVFTDRDQALLIEMIPTRKDHPEAAAAKIQNIDNIVRAKLKQPASGGGSSNALPQVGSTFQGGKVLNVRKVR